MTFPDLVQIAIGGGTAGLSFGALFVAVRWTANFIAGRLDKKETRLEHETEQHFARLTKEIERLSEECVALRERATTAEEHHAHCLEKLANLQGYVDGRGDARNDSATIVARDRLADKRRDKE